MTGVEARRVLPCRWCGATGSRHRDRLGSGCSRRRRSLASLPYFALPPARRRARAGPRSSARSGAWRRGSRPRRPPPIPSGSSGRSPGSVRGRPPRCSASRGAPRRPQRRATTTSPISWRGHSSARPRADDARMLELLEPYVGQRGRVQRLLEVSGDAHPPIRAADARTVDRVALADGHAARRAELQEVRLPRGRRELVAEVGMGDRDQRLGPLRRCSGHGARRRRTRSRSVRACARVVTTPAPSLMNGTIRENFPPPAVDGSAMIARPSGASEAPRTKSIWPPTPE